MENNTQQAATPAPAPGNASKQARIATSFLARNTQPQLAAAAGNIIIALTGNTAFPNPSPTLAAVTAARDAFVAKMTLAAGGGRLVTSQLADARVVLISLLRELALNLQQSSGGDRRTLVSTGYPLRKTAVSVGPLLAPAGMRLERGGVTGELIARCRATGNARAYQWRYATAQAPTAWVETGTTTQARSLLEGLVPGTQYFAQARLVGPKGASDWCDSVAMFAT
jgi:hypothetical protein